MATGVGFLMPLCTLALDHAVLRFVPSASSATESAGLFWSALVVLFTSTIFVTTVIVAASSFLGTVFFEGVPDPHGLVIAMALVVLGEGIITIGLAFFRGYFRPRLYTAVSVPRDLGWAVVATILAVAGVAIRDIVLCYAMWSAAVGLVTLLLVKREVGWSRPRLATASPMLRFGRPIVVAQPAAWLAKFGTIFVIGALLGPFDVGVYGIGATISTSLIIVLTVVMLAVAPSLTALFCKGRLGQASPSDARRGAFISSLRGSLCDPGRSSCRATPRARPRQSKLPVLEQRYFQFSSPVRWPWVCIPS